MTTPLPVATAVNWEEYSPKVVPSEDALGKKENEAVWSAIYLAVGLKSPGEAERRAVRLAIYAYGCKNGTSREGAYAGKIIMSTGLEFDASVIPQATGKYKIRRFFRANMDESYIALKKSGVMEKESRFVTKAANLGVSAENAFAMADWMSDCPLFTPGETLAHEATQKYSLERSRRNRGGVTLEAVEGGRVAETLAVSGPLNAGADQEW